MAALLDDLGLLIDRGGIVMVPLLVLSVVALALVLERAWFWLRQHGGGARGRLARQLAALRAGDRERARRTLDGDRSPYAEVARHLLAHGASDAVALEAVQRQRPRLERFMVALSTIITAAPLLGILGTVIGIIQSFDLLGQQDTLTDPRAVSAGIAEALLTTAAGLVVALLTLFPYMVYRGQTDRALGHLESVVAAAQQGAEPAPAPSTPRGARRPAATTAE